jgi:hypothetical protein
LAAGRSPGDENNNAMLVWVAVAVGAVALVGTLAHFGLRKFSRHCQHSHSALFQGLCDAHALDRNSRRLLAQVVRFHGLAQPARLFTEPEWLDPAALSGSFSAKTEELTALRNQLFCVSVPASR